MKSLTEKSRTKSDNCPVVPRDKRDKISRLSLSPVRTKSVFVPVPQNGTKSANHRVCLSEGQGQGQLYTTYITVSLSLRVMGEVRRA